MVIKAARKGCLYFLIVMSWFGLSLMLIKVHISGYDNVFGERILMCRDLA